MLVSSKTWIGYLVLLGHLVSSYFFVVYAAFIFSSICFSIGTPVSFMVFSNCFIVFSSIGTHTVLFIQSPLVLYSCSLLWHSGKCAFRISRLYISAFCIAMSNAVLKLGLCSWIIFLLSLNSFIVVMVIYPIFVVFFPCLLMYSCTRSMSGALMVVSFSKQSLRYSFFTLRGIIIVILSSSSFTIQHTPYYTILLFNYSY